jgi:CheY-like chemotaxis protein
MDTGTGMTAEQMEQIFEPFEQVGEGRRRPEGTGLGLTISRQLVELMDGQLQVTSELGQGSTFWFEAAFPVVKVDSAKALSAQREITGYAGERQHILVVDDRADIRMMLLNLLEPLGFTITLAENGRTGLEKAQQERPDLILMDLVMPVMNGFEAVSTLRQMPGFDNVPIVAISASAHSLDDVESRKVGCNAFLAKPIAAQKLFDLLESYLPIEWLSEEIPAEPEKAAPVPDTELVAPPREELEIVYELAMVGKMRRIREHADQLETQDPTYAPFARRLRELVRDFDDARILKLVQHYMEEEHES